MSTKRIIVTVGFFLLCMAWIAAWSALAMAMGFGSPAWFACILIGGISLGLGGGRILEELT